MPLQSTNDHQYAREQHFSLHRTVSVLGLTVEPVFVNVSAFSVPAVAALRLKY